MQFYKPVSDLTIVSNHIAPPLDPATFCFTPKTSNFRLLELRVPTLLETTTTPSPRFSSLDHRGLAHRSNRFSSSHPPRYQVNSPSNATLQKNPRSVTSRWQACLLFTTLGGLGGCNLRAALRCFVGSRRGKSCSRNRRYHCITESSLANLLEPSL